MTLQSAESILVGAALACAAALAAAVLALRRRCAMLALRVEHGSRELQRLQRSFARFAPRELVERIASQGMVTSGERREVTVMFADIRGFTQLSEELDPGVVVEMLNGYFTEMSRVIKAHHGHVTRVMGDGIMSVFGALEHNPWQVRDAVEAAIDMRAALGRYNEGLRSAGRPELGFGIGIHSGSAVAGLVGSDDLVEFTVMGDVVNVASRVEALTRELSSDILITEQVKERLGDGFALERKPPLSIKGKSRPVVTWAVVG